MGMRSKKNRHLRIQNTVIYNHYYRQVCALAQSMFEWKNLPETCDPWYFERTLLFNGTAAIYNLPMQEDTWLSTGYVDRNREPNVYAYPTNIVGVGYNQSDIPVDKFVICYDNVDHTSIVPYLELFAKRLYEIDQTFRSNLRQQNTPYIVRSDRNTLMTLRNFFNNLFGFDPVIECRQSSFDSNAIDVLDLRVNYIGRDLQESLDFVWRQAMKFLGITEATNKKERMVVEEVALNRMSDMVALNTRLLPRKQFCERFNRLTGMNLEVEVALDTIEVVPYEERSEDNEHTSTDNTSAGNSSADDTKRDNA